MTILFYMIFLVACFTKPMLSTSTWNRSADIRLSEKHDVPNFFQHGSYEFSLKKGKKQVHKQCLMKYTLYQSQRTDPVLVILSHGFGRNQGHMRQWAKHLASWGFSVLTPNHCHIRPSDVNPVLAAEELLLLSKSMVNTRVIYAGFSNGGAISIIAGAQDPKAIAVIGLDTTESYQKPTGPFAKRISIPVYGLFGEPSSCNAMGNGRELYSNITNVFTRAIQTADHCDFESPSGGICYLFCSGPHPKYSRVELRHNIISLTTAAALMVSEENVWGQMWWSPPSN